MQRQVYNINILFPHLVGEGKISDDEVNALIDHLDCFVAFLVITRLEMDLTVLYDARVHLPAFHALSAWHLAILASSTSLF